MVICGELILHLLDDGMHLQFLLLSGTVVVDVSVEEVDACMRCLACCLLPPGMQGFFAGHPELQTFMNVSSVDLCGSCSAPEALGAPFDALEHVSVTHRLA